jgi:Family of unknown function (DUF6427)
MILRQFRGTGPGTIILIVVTFSLVWASAFIRLRHQFSLYFDLDPMPLYGLLSDLVGTNPVPGIIFTLLLVILMAFSIVNLNSKLIFINERTFLPAVIYILLSGLFPRYQVLNPAVIGAIFLMIAIRRIMEAYRVQGIAYNFFDAALLIGIGSLFYANLIWFGLLVLIGIGLIRTWNLKEVFISLTGLLTPFLIAFAIFYISGRDPRELMVLFQYNLFGRPSEYAFSGLTIAVISFTGLITLLAVMYLFMTMNTKMIRPRKTFSLLLWLLVMSILLFIFVRSVSVEMIWITAIPVSYILSHYFIGVKKKWLPEIFFSMLYIAILVIQVWHLK